MKLPRLVIKFASFRSTVPKAVPVNVSAVIIPDEVWLILPVVEFRLAVPEPTFRLLVMFRFPLAFSVTP